MEKRRDEIGKLLACLLVSRKGVCDIRNLERDYYENEGKKIPYKEFGCSSSLDFFRSISNHIRLVPRSGSYVVYPVVSDKIKHVNELVSRQRPGRRQPSIGRRPSRISHYYPPVRDQKPFVPNIVQKEIGRILTQNPQGVNKSYIAQCLERSGAVAGNVNVNNIDDYLSGMPYTATARGNMVYPSRSLTLTTTNTVKRTITDIDGFEIVAQGYEAPRNEGRNNNSQDMNSYPAGDEEYDIDIEEDEYSKENTQPQSSNVDNNSYAANNDYQYHQALKTGNENKPRISSAEFIDRAGSQYTRSQSDNVLRENNNEVKNYPDGAGFQDVDNEEQDVNYGDNADYTFESDNDGSVDIISPRVQTRLKQLIQQCPDGLWCANLLQAYSDEYKVPLDYVDLGFGSVCEFASHLPKIFHLHRENNRGDFRLYDASQPLPKSALEFESHKSSDVWEDKDCEEDVDPFPMMLPLHASQSLIPHGVMTHGESVGQERIPEVYDGSDCIEIYVVEVYTPSLFWIHLRKQRSKLSQLMESMHEFYQKDGDNYIIPHVVLEKGLNCVCTFEDKWHRAIIKTVKPDGNVTLVFYDYGTTQTYPPESVRFLVRTYSNLPAQAIPCGLWNVKPVKASAWTRGVSSEFYARVADLPLVAMVVKVDKENNSMLVSLVDTQGATDDHINDWLVHAGLAESGFMVRSRPSNFVFRHYIACVNYCYEIYLRSQRLAKGVRVKSRANLKNIQPSDSESGTSSQLKLKAANYAKNLMAKHSKYQKESNDNVSKNSETDGANSQANINPIVHIRQRVKDCSSTNVTALPEIKPSLEKGGENHNSKIIKKKLNLMNPKRYDYKHLKTIAEAQRVSCKQSDNNSSISAQSSDDNNLCNKTSEDRVKEFVKSEDVGKLEFSGSFRSFYGGHGAMEPIDWSKIRNDIPHEQETVDQKTRTKPQAIAECSSWKLNEEDGEKSKTNQRTSDKCSDDLTRESLHRGMTSEFRKVTVVESVEKKIEKKIMPAKDCFINAVQCNKDHYYSVHGEMLWWSTDGNIQDKPGKITPLLRKRKKNFTQSDVDFTKVSASPEILQTLRGKKLPNKESGAIPKDVSDPELDFIIQLKRTANPSTFKNTKDDGKKLGALSNSRFAACLNYINKKKKQKEYSISEKSLSIERSIKALGTNSVETDFSNTSDEIRNLEKDLGTSNYSVKEAKENYTISQNQDSSNTHNSIKSPNGKSDSLSTDLSNTSDRIRNSQEDSGTSYSDELNHAVKEAEEDYTISQSQESSNCKNDSLSPATVQTVSESDELSEHNSETVTSVINESLENIHLTSSRNHQDTMSTVNSTNIESISKEVNCNNSTDENDGLLNTDEKCSKLPKVSQSCSKFCDDTGSVSELDSDDLSQSRSNSETDIDLTKNIESDTVDVEETSAVTGESSSDHSNDIQEQCERDNMLAIPDIKKQTEDSVSKNESKIFAPIVNDLESMTDSDEWDVHGDWRNLIEDESHFMSRVVRQLKIKNNVSESAKIVEVNDKSELDDVFDTNDPQCDETIRPITQENHEEKCKIQNTIDSENISIANRHCIKNLESSEKSNIESLEESEVISNGKLATHSNEDDKLIPTITGSFGDQNLSQCNETVIDKTNNACENSGRISTQNNDSTATATTSKKSLENCKPMSKTKSMYDMLKNFQSKQNLGRANSNLKKFDDSLQSKVNTEKIVSEIHCNENTESDVNTLNKDEERREMNERELFSKSEMSADSFNTSSSSQYSISVISNAMAGNETASHSTQYIMNRKKQHSSPEQHSTNNEESHSSSSDAIEFIEEQSTKPCTQFPILSRVKQQQLSVKSPIKDFGVQITGQTDANTFSEKDSTLSNESCESNNSLSRSFLEILKSMYP